MNKLYFLFVSSLGLISCFNTTPPLSEKSELPDIQNRCIQDRFVQGTDNNLYGVKCIEGKHLLLKTEKTGERVSTSTAVGSDNTDGLRLEGTLNFINEIYNPEYAILKNKGDDKQIPFLRDFFPENERFFGSLKTKYRIIFEIRGNYLVLFKASKELNDLPYIERTSVTKSKDGKYWMVPFLGYPIEYCNAEVKKNIQGQDTYEHLANCQASQLKDAKYIRIHKTAKQVYKYHYKEKEDMFPAGYFDGRWFLALGFIETPSREGHLPPVSTSLVEFRKTAHSLDAIDVSGNVEERNRQTLWSLFVKWADYEPNQNGSDFETFGERSSTVKESIDRPYLTVDFSRSGKFEIIDFLVAENYFSYVITLPTLKGLVKLKISLLKEQAVDTRNFVPRKWFKEVHNHYFGTLTVRPQSEKQVGDHSEEDSFEDVRMIRFNTSLNTSEEKRTRTKTITWYFSKYSTQDPGYRDLAREMIQIWNRAFEIIMKDSDKKIKLKLVDEEKDLGDLRYNLINLIETKDLGPTGRGLLMGAAPSYVHSNTGQVMGSTVNVFIQNFLVIYTKQIKDYIRYEIFQKNKNHKKIKEKNDIHVVTPYIRSQIANLKQCNGVQQFIVSAKTSDLKPADTLQDTEDVVSCAHALSKTAVLAVLIHEMGHSFGLGHNFKASSDKKNYYQSIEELKKYFPQTPIQEKTEIAKTSSVMDYLPIDVLQPTSYLGKYDLAALRFIYRDQVEAEDGEKPFLSLNIPSTPDLQEVPLTDTILAQKKKYSHCSDSLEESSSADLLCAKRDHGSNPLEIVQFTIDKYKRRLNSIRYRYDVDPKDWSQTATYTSITSPLWEMTIFYKRWLELRDLHLESISETETTKYILNDDKALEKYKDTIESNSTEEYRLYYGIKDTVFKFWMEFLFTKSMQCQVQNNNNGLSQFINLERIASSLLAGGEGAHRLYMEDCYSPQITDFFTANELELTGQIGVENFTYYYHPKKDGDSKNIKPLHEIWDGQNYSRGWKELFREPDLLKEFRTEVKRRLLHDTEGKDQSDFEQVQHLYKTSLDSLKKTLEADSDQSILKAHLDDLKTVKFSIGTSEDSIYQRVLKPLDGGLGIEDIAIPLLTDSYEDYEQASKIAGGQASKIAGGAVSIKGFKEFLFNRDDILLIPGESITIPFQIGSSSSEIISKYNENVKAIQELNGSQGLTVLEKMKKDSLREHNEVLKQIVEESIEL